MSQQSTEQVVSQGQPTGDNSQGAGTGQQQPNQGQQQTQQQNTAPYAEYLEKFPETVRGMAEPIFKEWDANVTQKFQQLHSQYGWAQPWQEIAQNYDPEVTAQALQLLDAMNADPQKFYEAVGNAYGFNAQPNAQQGQPGQQNGQQTGEENNEGFFDPRVDQLMQTVDTLAQILTQSHQQTQEEKEEQEFFQYLDGLKTQHGEFDMNYVLAQIAAGTDPEQAVQDGVRIHQALSGQTANNSAPVVMGSGGGVPSTSVSPNQFDRKQTQEFVASVLGAQKQ